MSFDPDASCSLSDIPRQCFDPAVSDPFRDFNEFAVDIDARDDVVIDEVTVEIEEFDPITLDQNPGNPNRWGKGKTVAFPVCQQVVEYQYTVKYRRNGSSSSRTQTVKDPARSRHRRQVEANPHCQDILRDEGQAFVVNTSIDLPDETVGDDICFAGVDDDGEALCSLRAAIMEANAKPQADIIAFTVGSVMLTRHERPGGPEDDGTPDAAWGDLDITNPVTIGATTLFEFIRSDTATLIPLRDTGLVFVFRGDTASQLKNNPDSTNHLLVKISGENRSRIFQIHDMGTAGGNDAAEVAIRQVMLHNGLATDRPGGAIRNDGALLMEQVAIVENEARRVLLPSAEAQSVGGGVYNGGRLTMNEVIIAHNRADGGGGVWNKSRASAILRRSMVSNNWALIGSGIWNEGPLEGTLPATITVENTTITRNRQGDAFVSQGNSSLNFVTINYNEANGFSAQTEGRLNFVRNSILDNLGSAESGCVGVITSLGGNRAPGNRCRVTPTDNADDRFFSEIRDGPNMLNRFYDLGGFTPVLVNAPRSDSDTRGVDAIDPDEGDCAELTVDQRGAARPIDGNGDEIARCDPGAYEYDPADF
ncbi:MAG: right-handed parallel beta-helix repeat-containing protein [Pseudomonadota bacterium]